MDGILGTLPWDTLTPGAIVTLFVVLIGLGWLTPRYYYNEKAKEADYWREAHKVSEQTRATAIAQVSVLARALDRLSGQRDLGASLIESAQLREEEP